MRRKFKLAGGCQGCGGQEGQDEYKPEFALEGGFYSGILGDGGIYFPFFNAYSSDKTKFDLDDVTLTYHYGHDMRGDIGIIMTDIDPKLDVSRLAKTIFFGAYASQSKKPLIFHVLSAEEFFTDEYRSLTTESGRRIYPKAMEIKIPQEIFVSEKGYIHFWIDAIRTILVTATMLI